MPAALAVPQALCLSGACLRQGIIHTFTTHSNTTQPRRGEHLPATHKYYLGVTANIRHRAWSVPASP